MCKPPSTLPACDRQSNVGDDVVHFEETNVKTYLLCFNEGCGDADYGNQANAKRIVIVVIQRPKYDTGNLKDVKRVNCLSNLIN